MVMAAESSSNSESQSFSIGSADAAAAVQSQFVVNEWVTALKQAWWNERAAPELLSYQQGIVEAVHQTVDAQESSLVGLEQAHLVSVSAVASSLAASAPSAGAADKEFQFHLYHMELDRVKFVLVAYLRTRIRKIESNVFYILSNQDMVDRLSVAEHEFATGYLDLVQKNLHGAFLQHIPETFRGLTDHNEDVRMVDPPELRQHVFMRVKDDIGEFDMDGGETVLQLADGDILVAAYEPFRQLIAQDKIQLI